MDLEPVQGAGASQTGGKNARLSDLDIFSHPAKQSDIESVYWEPVYPNEGSLDVSQKVMQFTVKPSMDMTSLADSYIEAIVSLKQKAANGVLTDPSGKIFPCNNVLYNLWKVKYFDLF